MSNDRRPLKKWFEESADLLEDFATETGVDAEHALEHIAKNRSDCRAQSRDKFISWAIKQIAKQPEFHVVSGIVKKFDLDVQNYLDKTTQGTARYADFPEYVKNGNCYLVNMGVRADGTVIVWTVPEEHWDFAQKVYPIMLKPLPGERFFIAKKIKGVVVPVHRLLFPIEPKDTIQSRTDNFLDWSSLYVRNFNRSGLYEGKRQNPYSGQLNTPQEEFDGSMKQTIVFTNGNGEQQDSLDSLSADMPHASKIKPNADLGTQTGVYGKIKDAGKFRALSKEERDAGLEDVTERFDRKTILPSEAISKASLDTMDLKQAGDRLDSDAADLRQAWGL